jgi:hypothetical protein
MTERPAAPLKGPPAYFTDIVLLCGIYSWIACKLLYLSFYWCVVWCVWGVRCVVVCAPRAVVLVVDVCVWGVWLVFVYVAKGSHRARTISAQSKNGATATHSQLQQSTVIVKLPGWGIFCREANGVL